ncbi:MAG: sensor histidine kinase [Sulfuriferula sp.]
MRILADSLRARITALVIGFCILIAAIFTLAVHFAHSAYNDELRQQQGLQFTHNVALMYPELGKLQHIQRDKVETQFEQMLLLEPSSALYLIDDQGRVRVGYSKQRSIGGSSHVNLAPIRQLLDHPDGKIEYGSDPDFPGMKCLFAAAPIYDGKAQSGYLYMLMRPPETNPGQLLASSYANRTALLVALSASLLIALFVWVVMAQITRPLRRLASAADQVRTAEVADIPDPASFPHQDRRDEIGHLSRAFRDMVQRLHEQVLRVRRMDATRRDWVASISHDLRTPLTSLTGHLETVILRGERLSEAERERFLQVALKNAQHLDRLSASLFDFARLDSDAVRLEKAPTHLGELIDDIAQRFTPAAETRGVHIECAYPEALPLVAADAALIERAIANLMENALRHTPVGGTIRLLAQPRNSGIELVVTDTGAGIAPADVAKVFERFFQGSQQREGHGHAGLGLAIVKRVAELHQGHVRAGNQPQGGACFSLWLPLNAAE